jgi:hypothetical protein
MNEQEITRIKNDISSLQKNLESSINNMQQAMIGKMESLVKSLVDQKANEFSTRITQQMAEMQATLSPQLNYEIPDPSNDPDKESSTFMEINFNSPDLHILGLQNQQLKWIATQDC